MHSAFLGGDSREQVVEVDAVRQFEKVVVGLAFQRWTRFAAAHLFGDQIQLLLA